MVGRDGSGKAQGDLQGFTVGHRAWLWHIKIESAGQFGSFRRHDEIGVQGLDLHIQALLVCF